jgi:hypothetical protein
MIGIDDAAVWDVQCVVTNAHRVGASPRLI